MKKFFILLLLLPLAFCSCDDDKQPRIETWTIASEKGAAGNISGAGYTSAYIVKRAPEADWESMLTHIQGFRFETGCESVLRVRIDPIPDPPMDGSSEMYTMVQLVSHTQMQSSIDIEKFRPLIELTVASKRSSSRDILYWVKDMSYTDPRWTPFIWEIEGFDYIPGNEYRIRIQAVAEYDETLLRIAHFDPWRVKYYLKEVISCEEKVSDRVPD